MCAWHLIPQLQDVQILEEAIKYRWGALPDQQRQGIRNYISNLIIKLSSDETVFRQEKVFLNKLNIILVQVIPCTLCLAWKGGTWALELGSLGAERRDGGVDRFFGRISLISILPGQQDHCCCLTLCLSCLQVANDLSHEYHEHAILVTHKHMLAGHAFI